LLHSVSLIIGDSILHTPALHQTIMLKLTMNPRKRSKRFRSIPHRLRLPPTSADLHHCEADEEEENDQEKDMLADNLKALLKQENSGTYLCSDYLSMTAWQHNVFQLMKKPKFEHEQYVPHHATLGTNTSTRIDEYCREQIVEWSFRVVDYFRIDREVVALSLSFLDRFLATCRCDRTSFKLAATTTLHLAVKLLYPCKLADLGILSDLSRGEFDMKDVSEMEAHILQALTWNLHPPTSVAFASILLDYFFSSKVVHLSGADLDDIYDVSSFFCELAVSDYFFVPMRTSCIALASILNALEGMFGPENNLAKEVVCTAQELLPELDVCNHDLSTSRNRLWELYERSEECALHNDKASDDDYNNNNKVHWHGSIFVKKMSTNMSPVSVSKPCHSASDFCCTSYTSPKLRNESW
jgi:Cyclin, N-terminal domain